MKVSLALLTFLLAVAALRSETSDGASRSAQNKTVQCCFTFITRRIPSSFVRDYRWTSSMCSTPGVIFTTRRGREICANPSDAWVQEYITLLEHQ